MKRLAIILTAILITLMSSLLLFGCQLLPIPLPEPIPTPSTEPEPTPTPTPEPDTPPDVPDEIIPIEDITWILEAYGDEGSLKALFEDTEITAEFKSADSTIIGSAGCNSYFVGYEIDNSTLTVSPPIGATAMACPIPIMDQEQDYFELLETAETFQLDNDRLIISCSDNKELVFVEEGTEEPPSIEDMAWELEAYGDVGSLQSLVTGTGITAEFKSAEGRVVGSAGCNSYFVDYEIDGNTLIITPPIGATMMLCPPAIMDQEQEYFELLKTTETFRVQNDRLIISCSDNKELVFVEK